MATDEPKSEPGTLKKSSDQALNEELYPDDAYQGTTYWADLLMSAQNKWIAKQSNDEAARELNAVWRMFKNDPLKPFNAYFQTYAVAGLGLLAQGYVLFSVGNVLSLFEAIWPQCWTTYTACNTVWVQSIDYLGIAGIIWGQIMIGIIGDWIGRRWGLIQNAVTMTLGALLLTAMWGTSLNGWVVMYAISLLIFGIGVGGEYPMANAAALERVRGPGARRDDKLHRGRNVCLAFLMQGWGQLLNQVVLLIFLLIFNSGGNPPYSETTGQATFRISFALAVVLSLTLIYMRVFKMKNVDQTSKDRKTRSKVTGYDVQSLRLVFGHYWHRLIATSICWYCNDFAFYGNQISRNVFLKLVTSSSAKVDVLWLYNLVNVGCQMVGYYLAAFLIDHKHYGRKRMQAIGFIMSFILFIIAASIFPILDRPGPGAHAFEAIYFVSSFWVQFGPNSTTFLLAGEVYPAPVRSTAHGLSAATGKLGALTATVLYNYIGSRAKFWVVSWFGLLGCFLTIVFIPDTTGLDLQEQERYWDYVRDGRPQDYHGIAIHPRHLSFFERRLLHRDKHYNAELDKKARIEELRDQWKAARSQEKRSGFGAMPEGLDKYFELETMKDDFVS